MNITNTTRSIAVLSIVVTLSACVTASPQGPTLATGESIRINEPVVRGLDSGVASKAQRAGRVLRLERGVLHEVL